MKDYQAEQKTQADIKSGIVYERGQAPICQLCKGPGGSGYLKESGKCINENCKRLEPAPAAAAEKQKEFINPDERIDDRCGICGVHHTGPCSIFQGDKGIDREAERFR